MGLIEKGRLLGELVPPLDPVLATQLVDEFVSMERRFIQRDWEPTVLDGGQFCEIAARVLYHQDSGTLNLKKEFDSCLEWLEEDGNKHLLIRRDALHIAKVLRTGYKFRSQRGAVHISPTYKPNHMDSKYLIEAVRWSFNEMLRLFWKGQREEAAKTIRELLQFDVPCIGVFEDTILVQRTDLTVEEEILVLLHFAGEEGFSRTELGKHVMSSPPGVTKGLQKLVGPSCRQVVALTSGRYRLTDLGSRRVREDLSSKLLLQ